MKKDKNAQDLANVSQKGYTDSRFDSYFQMLSEDHFPQIVLVNWTKKIITFGITNVNIVDYLLVNWVKEIIIFGIINVNIVDCLLVN